MSDLPKRLPRLPMPATATTTVTEPSREGFDPHVVAEDLAQRRRQRAATAQWQATVPRRYRAADWEALVTADPPHEPDTLTNLDAFCRSPLPFLVLAGPVGSGKTFAAAAVASRMATEHGWTSKFVLTTELFDELRPGNDNTRDAKRQVTNADLLVLDDLLAAGASLTEWEEKQIDAILSRRWMDERTTIITTNLGTGSLREVLGDRLYDRLRDGLAVVIKGDSRRGSRGRSATS